MPTLATYNVSFVYTYSDKRGKRTVFRNRTVQAKNPGAAVAKARRGIGPGGFSKFQIEVVK